ARPDGAPVKRVVAVAACALLATACAPHIAVVSPAPPNRIAALEPRTFQPDLLELSEGVAVAVHCWRSGAPCQAVHASVADPHVAGVHIAHVSALAGSYIRETNATGLVVVGLSPGTTTLHVEAEGHSTDYDVQITPIPARDQNSNPVPK